VSGAVGAGATVAGALLGSGDVPGEGSVTLWLLLPDGRAVAVPGTTPSSLGTIFSSITVARASA